MPHDGVGRDRVVQRRGRISTDQSEMRKSGDHGIRIDERRHPARRQRAGARGGLGRTSPPSRAVSLVVAGGAGAVIPMGSARSRGRPALEPGQLLQRGDHEPRVGRSSACDRARRAARRLAHGVCAGVDAQHERSMGGRVGQHEPAIARAQVHRRRGMGRGDIGQLADVHLGEAASGEQTHRPIIRSVHPSRPARIGP